MNFLPKNSKPLLRVTALLSAMAFCLTACPEDPAKTPEDMSKDSAKDMKDMSSTSKDMQDASDTTKEMDASSDMKVMLTPEQESILGVESDKTWELPGLSDSVEVVFTELGIPHVYAKNRDDLGYVLGFLVARDRYFVMDLQRRLAQGTVSSLLGDEALETDIESRITGMAHVTDLIHDNLREEDRKYFEAYAKGINHYIDQVRARKVDGPSELDTFKLALGVRNPADLMVPFTVKDIAAMVAVIVYETNFSTGDPGRSQKFDRLADVYKDRDVAEKALREAGVIKDLWEPLAPAHPIASTGGWTIERPGMGSNLLPPRQGSTTYEVKTGKYKPVFAPMLDRASVRLEKRNRLLGRKEMHNFGSNTWAVAGGSTKDGYGLVAGDGHLPLSVPALMYQIGMNTTVFGGGDIAHSGLLITSLPVLAVGTNGKIAWSQVNPNADITDWYREEIQLDANGKPKASKFNDEWKDLVEKVEEYEVAEVKLLMSVGRTEKLSRFTTFDGRWIFDIEGEELADDAQPGANESVVTFSGRRIVPKDMDNNGRIDALSFDYTAFDTTNYVGTLVDFTRAKDVGEFQESTKGLIGNMLYSAVADDKGSILFTSYQAVPCRMYLPKEDGKWKAGADPTMLLDGTTYGGFTIPSGADGKVDEAPGKMDPYKCVVPFDETPQAIKTKGYVLNANNQPAPIINDDSLANDPWYIGNGWAEFRADSIDRGLKEAIETDGGADVLDMADLQAERRSRLGELFNATFLQSITAAKGYSETDGVLSQSEQRIVDLYNPNKARLDEVHDRLLAWGMQGYHTHSGVETFYNKPSDETKKDAVATMIFNAWLPRVMQRVFSDERIPTRFSGSRTHLRALNRFLQGRGMENKSNLASFNMNTNESIFFDDATTTDVVEVSDEVILLALVDALDFLTAEQTAPGEGGFGTKDMSKWLWGLRHQVRFESLLADFLEGTDFESILDNFSITTKKLPLAMELSMDDPRSDLKWFPRPGDNFSVDASNPGFSGTRFTHGSGPVMRMVIALKDGKVWGENIIPGGQSGLNDSPHFADQAAKWLGNETVPLRYHVEDVVEGATHREKFIPASSESE